MYSKFQDKTVAAFVLSLCLWVLTSSLDHPDGQAQNRALTGHSVNKVVIDAGHGGKDPGCLGSTTKEKDIALNIALELGDLINGVHPDVEIIYTRDRDVFVPLNERARIANSSGADLFISIHCNTVARRNQAKGTETYIMGLHRADDNLNVAKRENSAITLENDYVSNYNGYDPDSPEAHIILSMYQNAYLDRSILLAQLIEDQFEQSVGRTSRGVKQAGFLVLRNTTMPSVLVETGFLSHDHDESFLATRAGQKAIAQGLLKAFTEYRAAMAIQTSAEDLVAAADESFVYYVQLFATDRPPDLNASPWNKYPHLTTKLEDNYYKYLAGPYQTAEDAGKSLAQFDQDGLSSGFIVAYQGEQRVKLVNESTTNGNQP